ncbi:MAG TPA: hypothetical protein VFH80_16715 [Solirubrobacteraceae bacterium]|nr:hypothetical protein [Solirubrobacteraceae bacterium]
MSAARLTIGVRRPQLSTRNPDGSISGALLAALSALPMRVWTIGSRS